MFCSLRQEPFLDIIACDYWLIVQIKYKEPRAEIIMMR